MKTAPAVIAALTLSALTACGSGAERQADPPADGTGQQMDAGTTPTAAPSAGPTPVAFGLSETQLLNADLVAADGTTLGDIEQVRRDAGGAITGLMVELANTDPGRYVVVPLAGLSAKASDDDTDLQTKMTAAELAALPDATLRTR